MLLVAVDYDTTKPSTATSLALARRRVLAEHDDLYGMHTVGRLYEELRGRADSRVTRSRPKTQFKEMAEKRADG
jgi:hypothetical protein